MRPGAASVVILTAALCLAACSGKHDKSEEKRRAPSSIPLGIELAALPQTADRA